MSGHQDPHAEMRERFRAAAARQIELEHGQSRLGRWRSSTSLRLIAVLVGVGVTGAGVATAVNLISVGEERADVAERPDRYRPVEGRGPVVVITADDPAQKLPWGVATYTSPTGERCALIGHALGPRLGVIEDGEFRPYETNTGGACGNNQSPITVSQSGPVDGRWTFFGRAREDVVKLELLADGEVFQAPAGPGGAFLFVLDAAPKQADLRALDAEGQDLLASRP